MSKKMSDKNKSLILIGAILLLFVTCFLSGFFIGKGSNNKSITEYQNTIDKLTESNKILRESNNGLKDLNTELSDGINKLSEYNEQLRESNNRLAGNLREANGIISDIGKGIAETDSNIEGIIRELDSVIEEIKNSGDSE